MFGNLLRMGIQLDGENLEVLQGNILARNLRVPFGKIYYVDKRVASSGNGRAWNRAFKTIQEAIDRSNADIDWGAGDVWPVDNWIYVAPGEYAEALTPAYSAHIIGLGQPGTDQAVEIHPAEGVPLSGTALGLHLHNLRFETTETDVDVLDFGICNNSLIENCELVVGIAGGDAAKAFLSTENCTHLRLYNCSFQFGGGGSSHGYGIYFGGGADKFAHHVDLWGNTIQGIRSGGTGIYVQNTCTASNAVAKENVIKIAGAAKGIDDNNGGLLCVENKITILGAGDAIEHAGGAGFTINNQTVVNGVALRETAYA